MFSFFPATFFIAEKSRRHAAKETRVISFTGDAKKKVNLSKGRDGRVGDKYNNKDLKA